MQLKLIHIVSLDKTIAKVHYPYTAHYDAQTEWSTAMSGHVSAWIPRQLDRKKEPEN